VNHPEGTPHERARLGAGGQQIADATSKPPFLYELGPDGARKVLDDIQAAPIAKPDIDETWITVPAEVGDVPVRIVKPLGAPGPLPVVLYVHGGGWVLGNAGTHDRLVRELAGGTNAALVFVEYDRSPEAHYPVAIEQAYATARWIVHEGHTQGLDGSRLAANGIAEIAGPQQFRLDELVRRSLSAHHDPPTWSRTPTPATSAPNCTNAPSSPPPKPNSPRPASTTG
jgi:hypothetical protein